MSPAPPTARELLIVGVLVVLFLLFSSRELPSLSPPNHPLVPSNRYSPSSTPLVENQGHNIDTLITWDSSNPPETTIRAHVPGWTLFEKLYIFNGIVYIVSDNPSTVPDVQFITSKGIPILPEKGAEDSRLPTKNDIQIITSKQARKIFGGVGAQIIDGLTWLVNDPPQFITHYYHWSAELWFGFWRTYSSTDPTITVHGDTALGPPRRIMFTHLDNFHWRDYAHMNEWVVRSSFPSVTMEFVDDWRDRMEMGCPFVFEKIVLADRSAAMLSYNFARYQRTASSAFALPGGMNWWRPIRNNVVSFAGVNQSVGSGTRTRPVITYISRQKWGRRMLIPEHHEKLVKELYKLRDQHGYEVNVVNAEKMSRLEQIQLAAKTTILMGVHGNGLTSLVWMNPNPRSTVMEFFFPGGFAFDYEYTTRALGMRHYGFWNDKYFTSPNLPQPRYVEGFQSNEIPIDGEIVARLCVERLSLANKLDG